MLNTRKDQNSQEYLLWNQQPLQAASVTSLESSPEFSIK